MASGGLGCYVLRDVACPHPRPTGHSGSVGGNANCGPANTDTDRHFGSDTDPHGYAYTNSHGAISTDTNGHFGSDTDLNGYADTHIDTESSRHHRVGVTVCGPRHHSYKTGDWVCSGRNGDNPHR